MWKFLKRQAVWAGGFVKHTMLGTNTGRFVTGIVLAVVGQKIPAVAPYIPVFVEQMATPETATVGVVGTLIRHGMMKQEVK
ncbi:MAG TPA: hypothetical protein VFB99_03860 [Vicinamibacterales bacterium]|nr:hypothetical protein [Vicinamibacterales bacterium]